MLVQSKLVWLRLRLAMPQASLLPLLICAGSIVPWPLAFNSTLRSWQTATGGIKSTTVTVAVQVALLVLLSVTVRVTRFVPMLLQSKLVWLRLRLAMPEASLLPLLIWAALIVPWPVASSWTAAFWHTATGWAASTAGSVA